MFAWYLWNSMLLAVGFLAGAITMVLFGWEPLFRSAIYLTRKRATTPFVQCSHRSSGHATQWTVLTTLCQAFAEHSLNDSDMHTISLSLAQEKRDHDTFFEKEKVHSRDVLAEHVATLPVIVRIFAFQHNMAHLMDCLSTPAQMQPLEKALIGS